MRQASRGTPCAAGWGRGRLRAGEMRGSPVVMPGASGRVSFVRCCGDRARAHTARQAGEEVDGWAEGSAAFGKRQRGLAPLSAACLRYSHTRMRARRARRSCGALAPQKLCVLALGGVCGGRRGGHGGLPKDGCVGPGEALGTSRAKRQQ